MLSYQPQNSGSNVRRRCGNDGEHMTKLDKIESAVGKLADHDYREFRRWFLEHDWAKWDERIESDFASGKLDFLVREARDEKAGHGSISAECPRATSR
jgi:hypothetical protein